MIAAASDVVAEVAGTVGLAEGERGVHDVVAAIARLAPVPVRTLSREVGLPVPIVAAICNELRKRGIVSHARPVRLTTAGHELFGDLAHELALPGICPACDATGIPVGAEWASVADGLDELEARAPRVRTELDQSHCTGETKLRRVAAMHEAGALVGRRILFLGDDDLTSLALARQLLATGAAGAIARLTVLDVDPDVLGFLRAELEASGFDAECVEHDLRDPLPPGLAGGFDTVFTDPPYTTPGAELFLSRAVQATGPVPGRDVFFCFGRRRPDDALAVQATFTELGMVLRSLTRNFNDYVGAGILGGTSDLYHLSTTSGTAPALPGRYPGALYTADVRDPTRTYACAQCGAELRVGPSGDWPTIEALQANGCPRCGARTFAPRSRGR